VLHAAANITKRSNVWVLSACHISQEPYGHEIMPSFHLETFTPSQHDLLFVESSLPTLDRRDTPNKDGALTDRTFLTSCKVPTCGNAQQQQLLEGHVPPLSTVLAATAPSGVQHGHGGAWSGTKTHQAGATAAAASTPLWFKCEGLVGQTGGLSQNQWHTLPPLGVACSTDMTFHGKLKGGNTAATAGQGGGGAAQEQGGSGVRVVPRLQLLQVSSSSPGSSSCSPRALVQGRQGGESTEEVAGTASAPGGFKGKARQSR
jgi:hypothetical protein